MGTRLSCSEVDSWFDRFAAGPALDNCGHSRAAELLEFDLSEHWINRHRAGNLPAF